MMSRRSLKRRYLVIAVVIVFVCIVIVPALANRAFAAGQLTSRKITMSTSLISATADYDFSFSQAVASAMKGVKIEFCSNSPIQDDTCTAPTGFSVGTPSVSGWTASKTGNNVILLNSATGVSTQAVTFTATGLTNPSATNTTFYGRIYTYTDEARTTLKDFGGVALSTANQVTVTAKVQEIINFCIFTGANCAAGGSAIALGDATNGVLSYSTPYVNKNTKLELSSNALNGVVVVLKGTTLTSGGNTITATGTPGSTSSVGSEQFGMCVHETADPDGKFLAESPYNHASCSSTSAPSTPSTAVFAFDSASTTAAAGDIIAQMAAGNKAEATLAFLGNIGLTTEAGIYTTTLTFIATGTY